MSDDIPFDKTLDLAPDVADEPFPGSTFLSATPRETASKIWVHYGSLLLTQIVQYRAVVSSDPTIINDESGLLGRFAWGIETLK